MSNVLSLIFVQMAQPPIYEIDADGTIRTNALHWEGFPRILWETLSEVGYTTPPLYEVVSFWDQGVPYARTTATMLPHPEHSEWAYLSTMFFAHRGVESVESAAMRILHTFCEQHPDEVMLTRWGCSLPWTHLTRLGVSVSRSPTCCSRRTL
jgi:hypothetical protein